MRNTTYVKYRESKFHAVKNWYQFLTSREKLVPTRHTIHINISHFVKRNVSDELQNICFIKTICFKKMFLLRNKTTKLMKNKHHNIVFRCSNRVIRHVGTLVNITDPYQAAYNTLSDPGPYCIAVTSKGFIFLMARPM